SSPGIYVDAQGTAAGRGSFAPGRTVLGSSPLYHTNGFSYCYPPLLAGAQVVLMEHFDAALAVELIERYRVAQTVMVPTMLQRVARLKDIRDRDLSSLEHLRYGGASLPEWVARVWLGLIRPERFHIAYGGSEQIGRTECTGKEWLEHPGTVGL